MADVPVVHREQLPASGTWSPRPSALSGITPKAVIVWGQYTDSITDDSALADNAFFIGMSDGTDAYCRSHISIDAGTTSDARAREAGADLIWGGDVASTTLIEVEAPTLVSGGFDATITTATNRPYVNMIFFHGASWQVHMERTVGITTGTRTITTGFSGSGNNNQIAFFLSSINATPSSSHSDYSNRHGPALGMAYRQGAAGAPGGQCASTSSIRDGIGTSVIVEAASSSRCAMASRYNILHNAVECTDISDASITLTYRAGSTSRGMYTMALETDDTKVWCGIVDSLTANGTFTVSGPNFQGGAALLQPTQVTTEGDTLQTSDVAISGLAGGDADGDYSAAWSDEDAAANMVAKSIQDNQFMNFLQDDGTSGWKSGASDFNLTSTGFEVTNVVVGGGATTTARKWLAFVVEGEAAGETASPGLGTISLEGAASTIFAHKSTAPTLGTASFEGLAPTTVAVTGTSTSPGLGTTGFRGLAPTTFRAVATQPTVGMAAFSGLPPTVVVPGVQVPGAGAASFEGLAPTTSVFVNLTPTTGAAAFEGLAPTAAGLVPGTVSPTTGTMAAQGKAPTATADAVFGEWNDIPRQSSAWTPYTRVTTTWTPL